MRRVIEKIELVCLAFMVSITAGQIARWRDPYLLQPKEMPSLSNNPRLP
jgi:hypothetical protein